MKNFIRWYIAGFICCCLMLAILFLVNGVSVSDVKALYPEVILQFMSNWLFWLLLLIPYGGFRLYRYLFKSYRNHSLRVFSTRLVYSVVLPVGLVFSIYQGSWWLTKNETYNYEWDEKIENRSGKANDRYTIDGKHRGVHVFGPMEPDSNCLQPIIKNNVEWITLVPYGRQQAHDSPTMGRSRRDSQRALRRDSSFRRKIELAHAAGLKVMLKPHIWMSRSSDGKWRSDIFPKNEEQWASWSTSYRQFIFHYAHMAAQSKVEMFCVGTELSRLAKEKPDFWRTLIREVRAIYPGQLTYAANWHNEFEHIRFWDELDYIGVQAYFPLSKQKNPDTRELRKGWKRHITQMGKVHKRFNKPILFTELGYKSTADSAVEPWAWVNRLSDVFRNVSTQTQANCYEAFFKEVWPKKWFAGVHIWQWRNPYHRSGGSTNLDFTPQRKPAENIIAKGFGDLE